jgi:hypothetical protein
MLPFGVDPNWYENYWYRPFPRRDRRWMQEFHRLLRHLSRWSVKSTGKRQATLPTHRPQEYPR